MYFSIIIPIYNGEKHIEKMIWSILNQTFADFEIICINDGSTDNSLKILKELRTIDKRVKIINKENSGVSDSRNIGIKNSNGDFLMFADCDDMLNVNALMELKKYTKIYSLTLFGFSIKGSKSRKNDTVVLKRLKCLENNKKLLRESVLSAIIRTKHNIGGYVWRAVYSRRLILENNISFEKGIKISEDYLFLLLSCYYSSAIGVCPKELYCYCINDFSVTSNYIPTLLNDMEKINDIVLNNIVKTNEQYEKGFQCCKVNTYLQFIQNESRNHEKSINDILKQSKNVRKNYEQTLHKVCFYPSSFYWKPYFGIVLFMFRLEYIYIILFRIKNKFWRKK